MLLTLQHALYAFSDGLCKGKYVVIINTTKHKLMITQHKKRFHLFKNIPVKLAANSKVRLHFANNKEEWRYLIGPFDRIPAIYSVTLDVKVVDYPVTTPPLLLKGTIRFPGCILNTTESESTAHFRVDGQSNGKMAVFTIIDIKHSTPQPWYKRLFQW